MQETQLTTWTEEMIDCDGCGNWILTGDQIEIVDDENGRYHFCEDCAA